MNIQIDNNIKNNIFNINISNKLKKIKYLKL